MAQTTGATTARAATVGYSSDGSSWTDISGFAMAVTGASQDRMSGEVYTFDGDTAIIGATGNFRFTTPACYITSFGYPEIEAENAGDPVPGSLTIRPGYVTKAAVP